MRVRNKELRQRWHRKAQRIKEIRKELMAGAVAKAKPEKEAAKPKAEKPAAKKAAAPKAEKPAAKKAPAKKKAEAAEPAAEA